MDDNLFIITGIDGVGKTTLASWLVDHLKSKGYKSKYVWIRYQHTLAYILSRALMSLGWKRTFRNPNGYVISRFEIPESYFSKKIWPIIEFISILPLIIFKIKIPIFLNYKIVCDRYTIDTIVSVILNTGNLDFLDSFLGALLLKFIPKKNVIFLLDADSKTVLKRRPDIEYSNDEIIKGLLLYRKLSKEMRGFNINVKNQKINEVRDNVLNALFFESSPLSKDKKMPFYFSMVIPTCNRAVRLKSLLESILKQEKSPLEVIVIDQSDFKTTFNLIKKMETFFSEKKISLVYHYLNQKSASKARNIGIEKAKGEIVFFIDDDVLLYRDYTKKIIDVYKSYQDAVGVQGLILSRELLSRSGNRIENVVKKMFFLSFYQKDTWKVLPSVNDVFPFPLTKIIRVPRFQGICSYTRQVLESYRYDERLTGWSFLEDFDISYRINKSKMGSLYMTPEAKLVHNEHRHTESSKKIESYKKIVNRAYIFFKLFNQSFINYLLFGWSLMGYILTTIFGMILGRHKEKTRLVPIYMIRATLFTLKHLRDIKKCNMEALSSLPLS